MDAVRLRYSRELYIEDEDTWTDQMTETLITHFDEIGVNWVKYGSVQSLFGYKPRVYRMQVQAVVLAKPKRRYSMPSSSEFLV